MALSEDQLKTIRDVSLAALHDIFSLLKIEEDWNDPVAKKLHRGIGITVGTIDNRILEIIYEIHPEWQDNPLKRNSDPEIS